MLFTKYLKNTQGQGMSEYLILVLLIAVASITMAQGVGKSVYSKLKLIQQEISHVSLNDVRGDESGSTGGKGSSSSSGWGGFLNGLSGNHG